MLAWFLRNSCNYYLRLTTWSTCKKQLLESAVSSISGQTDGFDRWARNPTSGHRLYLRSRHSTVTRLLHTSLHTQGHSGQVAQHTTLRLLWALWPSGRTAPKPRQKIHWHIKIRQNHRISAAQIHGKVHETGAVRSGTWRGRGAAHAPASILVRPPRGYHCNMAATHFLAEVLRWFLLLISTTAFFVTVPNSCGFTALILIHILMENRER